MFSSGLPLLAVVTGGKGIGGTLLHLFSASKEGNLVPCLFLRKLAVACFWDQRAVSSGQQLLSPKKTVNTGGKRGGNPGHTIFPLCFAIFLRVF